MSGLLAEATVPQIATFTGLKDVEAILDAHYLGRDVQLAEAAVCESSNREQKCKPRLVLASAKSPSA